MKKKGVLAFWLVLAVLIVGGFGWTIYEKYQPGEYDALAQCLKDKGVTFYGAFWCPHCQAQKKFFGNSAKYLPYVECSQPDGKSQTQVCIDAGITTYPTWQFPDGARITGEQQPAALAEKSGCALPQ